MKKMIMNLIVCFLASGGVMASNQKTDEIDVFLVEYQNSEKTGNVIHLDMHLFKDWKGKISWEVGQELFYSDEVEHFTIVSLKEDNSDSIYTDQLIHNLKWKPNESVVFDYEVSGGNIIHFVAKAPESGGKSSWNITAKGFFKINDSAKPVEWILKKGKDLKLEFPSLKLE